jgi:hypothetical protein
VDSDLEGGEETTLGTFVSYTLVSNAFALKLYLSTKPGSRAENSTHPNSRHASWACYHTQR